MTSSSLARRARAAVFTASLACVAAISPTAAVAQPATAQPTTATTVTGARTFSPADLVRLDRISDPQLSPDGAKLAYVLRETDMAANRGRTDLWLLDLSRSDAKPAAADDPRGERLESPRWAPAGDALYFLSTRSGGSAGVAARRSAAASRRR
jgi:hypothetical protein